MDGNRPTKRKGGGRSIKVWAAVLAILVHVGILTFLIFSVRWQNKPTAPVVAELYAPQKTAPQAEREPVSPPPPPPAPEPEPQPQPQPKPKPKAEPKPKPEPPPPPSPPSKAELALKAKQEKERKEQERKRLEQEKKEKEKQEAKKLDEERKQREAKIKEQQVREAQALRQIEERARLAQLEVAQAARNKALATYIDRIRNKIKGNIIPPPDIPGNPNATVDVIQLPTGEVIDVKLRKPSGFNPWDEAVQRAILKSSPLPKPDQSELFERHLVLDFRPFE